MSSTDEFTDLIEKLSKSLNESTSPIDEFRLPLIVGAIGFGWYGTVTAFFAFFFLVNLSQRVLQLSILPIIGFPVFWFLLRVVFSAVFVTFGIPSSILTYVLWAFIWLTGLSLFITISILLYMFDKVL